MGTGTLYADTIASPTLGGGPSQPFGFESCA
jgi:hypothetical protein